VRRWWRYAYRDHSRFSKGENLDLLESNKKRQKRTSEPLQATYITSQKPTHPRFAVLKRCFAISALAAVLVSGLNGIGPAIAEPAAPNVEAQSVHVTALRTGDLVRLRSGGPLITVRSAEGDQVNCYWSTDEGNVLNGSFPVADLTAPLDPR
jgi:uncharacterized protein YodC (DUF2158 family)